MIPPRLEQSFPRTAGEGAGVLGQGKKGMPVIYFKRDFYDHHRSHSKTKPKQTKSLFPQHRCGKTSRVLGMKATDTSVTLAGDHWPLQVS